jgi:thioredoxin 2
MESKVTQEILSCPSCGAANRVAPERVSANVEAVCGECGAALGVTTQPLTVSDDEFQAKVAQSPLPVLVDFWAPWCGPCRMVAPSLEAIAREMAGRVRVAKINVDDNPLMAGKLGVRGIPTMVLFKDGKEVDRQVGALPKGEIQRWLEAVA